MRRIHIVCRDLHEDKILPRLARTLAEGTGWTLSEQPAPRADINYFMVYIDYAERFPGWHETRVAAYFSHYEAGTPFKERCWEQAARAVDLCVLTSRQYAERLPGKRPVIVRPPVDPAFTPGAIRAANSRPRIGLAGWVDPSGRKGASLVHRLASDYAERVDFTASGHGWPVPTKLRPLAELPAWYRSLDLFLCTATIEGIPMPPLEALACGVPVVIPHGVGLLDDLPEVPGLFRYKAGDYAALRAALEAALEPHNRFEAAGLPAAVVDYSPANWCADHRAGFADAVFGSEPSAIEPAHLDEPAALPVPSPGWGAFYVAYGGPARQCVQAAIASFKTQMPGVPVALVSDRPLGPEDIFIAHPDEDIGGRSAKTLIDALAPAEWQAVLYLDADTEVTADISFLFQAVQDGFDLVICKNPGRFHTTRHMRRPDNGDECEATFALLGTDELIQLNGGVFAYGRNERTAAFFAAWHAEWQRWGKRDQAALLRALWACPVRLLVLGNEWNTVTRYDDPRRSAGILHYPMTARRWRGVQHGRSDSPDAWAAVREFEAQNV